MHSNDAEVFSIFASPLLIDEPPPSSLNSGTAGDTPLSCQQRAASDDAKEDDQAGRHAALSAVGRPPSSVQNHFESRARVHSMINTDMRDIVALRELIDKKLADPDQQSSLDATFASFVDSLREAQVMRAEFLPPFYVSKIESELELNELPWSDRGSV